jgi:hypothetical protein
MFRASPERNVLGITECPIVDSDVPANFGIIWLPSAYGEEVGTVGEWLNHSGRGFGTMEPYYNKGGLQMFKRNGPPIAEIRCNEPKPQRPPLNLPYKPKR